MTAPEVEIRQAWRHLVGAAHDGERDDLLARYREPWRHYHSTLHVMWVLRHVDDLVQAESTDPHLAKLVRAAALFHDVVYDAHRVDNERRSADLATTVLNGCGWDTADTAAVADLIAATVDHDPACPLPGADVLFDADLAILGASPADYSASVNAIRREYAHVPAELWQTGRAEVLHRFLDRDPLYLTATMRAAREARARANLTAELATLR